MSYDLKAYVDFIIASVNGLFAYGTGWVTAIPPRRNILNLEGKG